MRVLILNHYADAPDRPTGTRHYTLARAVVRHGGEVTIFASAFDHGLGRDTRLDLGRLTRSRKFEGVRFVWLRTIPYRGNTWRRMANMVSYAVMAVLADIGRPRPDVVVGSTVHPFAPLAAWVIAKRRGVPFMYEIRDLWPQTLIDIGAMRSGSVGSRLLYAIEGFLTRNADIVIALLPGIPEYLEERGLPSHHVRYLPNGADFSLTDAVIPQPDAADPVRRVLDDIAGYHASGDIVFAYVGSHGRVNRLDIVIRAAKEAVDLGSRPFRLLFVGDGPEKVDLERLAAELSLTNVHFVDPVPKARVPLLLAAIDVGVVHATYTPVYRYGISFNKVFDYMAARRPIAFACTAVNDPVKASGGGLSVPPDDPRALAEAFVKLAAMPASRRKKMGAAGRAFVEREHDMQQIGDRFVEIIGESIGADVPSGRPGRG